MAKRKKETEVEINETKNNTDQFTELELMIRKKVVGKIQQDKNKPVTVEVKSGSTRTARTVDEGIQMIIEDYNLHN